MGNLIGAFDVRRMTLGSSDAKWRGGRWIVPGSLERPPSFVRRGAFRRDAANLSDVAAEFFRGNILAKSCSGRLGDVFFHQRSAEIVGAGLQAGEGSIDPELHPGNLDVADGSVEQHAGKRMNAQMFVAQGSWARATMLEQARVLVNESQRNEFCEAAGALLNRAQ